MTAVTIKNPDGSTFKGCECIAAVWDELNAEARRRGIVKSNFDVYQGSYNTRVKASAKTHFGGGVLDIAWVSQSDTAKIKAQYQLLDEFGFCPFRRGPKSYDGFGTHFHLCLRGCPHMHWQAANQVASWLAGRDGLVRNWKDRDCGWRVTTRDWKQALAWYTARMSQRVQAAQTAKWPPFSYKALMLGITGAQKGKPTGNVRLLQHQLNRSNNSKAAIGKNIPEDGIWGPLTQKVFASYQRRIGFTGKAADGIPGLTSVTRLMGWARNPYRVVA